MFKLCFVVGLHVVAFVMGIFIGQSNSTRVPAIGWVGLALALMPLAVYWMTSWLSVPLFPDVLISTVNFCLVPVVLFYSLHAYRHAPDRLAALAAVVSAIIVTGIALFGLILMIILVVGDFIKGPDFSL